MKEKKNYKKKVVRTSKKEKTSKKTISPTSSKVGKAQVSPPKYGMELIFDKQNFLYMGIGLLVILLGFVLMAGGEMEDPNVWDPNVIYSFRRVTLAPIVVLIGLGIEIYAIFKK